MPGVTRMALRIHAGHCTHGVARPCQVLRTWRCASMPGIACLAVHAHARSAPQPQKATEATEKPQKATRTSEMAANRHRKPQKKSQKNDGKQFFVWFFCGLFCWFFCACGHKGGSQWWSHAGGCAANHVCICVCTCVANACTHSYSQRLLEHLRLCAPIVASRTAIAWPVVW